MSNTADQQQKLDALVAEFHGQTARISWHDLQTYYARGAVVQVAGELDLVDVAVQLRLDNAAGFQSWMDGELVGAVSEDLAREWFDNNTVLWSVVVAPWVLVQLRETSD
jgi:hypothetical protein